MEIALGFSLTNWVIYIKFVVVDLLQKLFTVDDRLFETFICIFKKSGNYST